MHTPNPPAFEAAVRAHLAPTRAQFNYEQMLHTFLSVDRFRTWAHVVGRSRDVAGTRFLSSGCGFGGSLVAYHDAGAATVTGVEVDAEYARFAGLRVAGLATASVARVAGTPPLLPFADETFDLIESMDVIEHTADPRAYLAELVRVLAPDGLILLVTPNRLWPVEQHLGIAGPPWLPVGVGDVLFGALARTPGVGADLAFKCARLRGMRTQNISLRRLRGLARELGLLLRLVRPAEHAPHWPLPRDPAAVERMLDHRVARFLAPSRTLVVTLARGGRHRV